MENPAMTTPEDSSQTLADSADVQPATLSTLGGKPSTAKVRPDSPGGFSLDMILDVNVTLSIEVGRTRMSINDLLKLNQGAIIELDRMAGEPLDVLVNGTLVARGEIVVVKEKFGIMLTEVVSPEERVRKLR